MSENINTNINNTINPENIETIDFDELDKLNETNEVKETKETEEVEEIKEVAESDNDEDIIENVEDIENAEIAETNDFLDSSLPPLSFQEQIENDEFLKEAYERVERDREKSKNLVSLDKLGELKEGEVKYLQIGDACIEVRSKLPYKQFFDAIQWAIVYLADGRPYISIPLEKMITEIGFLKAFTNIDFSEIDELDFKLEKFYNIYDIITSFNLIDKVQNFVEKTQVDLYFKSVNETLSSIIKYQNSAAGILEQITNKTANTADDINSELAQLKDEDTLSTIRELMKVVDSIK